MLNMFASILLWLPYPLIAIVLSLCMTWIAIRILPHFGLMDIPHGRHMHKQPVPRGGGVAIVVSFFLATLMMALMLHGKSGTAESKEVFLFLRNFILPALLIVVTGILDDRYDLRSFIKLFLQIAAGVILYFEGCGITAIMGWNLPVWFGLPLTVCWVAGIINAFNLIDGLDGIAAGLASISSFSMALWILISGGSPAAAAILFVFCGACLGFLRFNFSPAKIFMGDTGSMFLGLFFAYISMKNSSKAITFTSLMVPLMAIGVPVFDVFLAIWRRFFRRYVKKDLTVSIMDGDHDHLHHRILKAQGNQRKTAWVIYSLAIVLSGSAMMSVLLEDHLPALVFLVFLLAIFSIIRYANIEFLDTLTCAADGLRLPHRNFILTALHPMIDFLLILASFFFVYYLLFPGLLPEEFLLGWVFIFIAPFALCLSLSNIYRTFWLRAGISRFYKLLRCLIVSGVIGFSLIYLVCAFWIGGTKIQLRNLSGFYLFFFLLVIFLIAGERFLIRYFESFGLRTLYLQDKAHDPDMRKVLIYGGGLFCRLFLSTIYCGYKKDSAPLRVVGIIDDNQALQHLNVYGFNILGTSANLPELYKNLDFDEIVITFRDIPKELKERFYSFGKENNVSIRLFWCGLSNHSEKI